MYDLGVIRRILILQLVLHGPQDCVGVIICEDLGRELRSDEGGGEETTQDCPKHRVGWAAAGGEATTEEVEGKGGEL